jgi:hypothetical protein
MFPVVLYGLSEYCTSICVVPHCANILQRPLVTHNASPQAINFHSRRKTFQRCRAVTEINSETPCLNTRTAPRLDIPGWRRIPLDRMHRRSNLHLSLRSHQRLSRPQSLRPGVILSLPAPARLGIDSPYPPTIDPRGSRKGSLLVLMPTNRESRQSLQHAWVA